MTIFCICGSLKWSIPGYRTKPHDCGYFNFEIFVKSQLRVKTLTKILTQAGTNKQNKKHWNHRRKNSSVNYYLQWQDNNFKVTNSVYLRKKVKYQFPCH